MKAYYYTPITYHCYQMGPRDMLAGCSVKQSTLDDPQELTPAGRVGRRQWKCMRT